ncbi:MAG: glycosyltransferase family 2 protein [Bacteroidota bacterium]
MKVSIITVVYNGEATIASAITSVRDQDYSDIEYIIVDGASQDRTVEIVREFGPVVSVLISEPDRGLYDAMNKGIARATGDVIGILNADDLYAGTDIISSVVQQLQESGADSLVGDLVYVKPDQTDNIVRYYRSQNFQLKRFEVGDMPPHPTFFARRNLYEQHGNFNTEYRIVADFDLMLRFLYKAGASFTYLPKVMVKMRTGGLSDSGWSSKVRLNQEIKRSLAANGLPASSLKIYSKYFRKIWQLVRRPAKS